MAEDPALIGRHNQMQRVRVGMIGLACVFLLVMLATAFVSLGRGGMGADNLAQAAPANDSAPREPLADLGVVPGAQAGPQTPPKRPHR